MPTIIPQGEALRSAVKWISDQRKSNPAGPDAALVSEASARFDLAPRDAEFLSRFLREARENQEKEE